MCTTPSDTFLWEKIFAFRLTLTLKERPKTLLSTSVKGRR